MNKITVAVALEVAAHEGLVRQAYKDSVGIWTWSVGLTRDSGHRVKRYIDRPQSLRHCLDIWLWAMGRYAQDVTAAMGPLAEHQFAAALSFHWNTGAIARAQWVVDWRAGRTRDARAAFMNWRSPPEIIPRREKERDLFFEGTWSNDGKITEYTRLTRKKTPDWSSARRVKIAAEVKDILGATQ